MFRLMVAFAMLVAGLLMPADVRSQWRSFTEGQDGRVAFREWAKPRLVYIRAYPKGSDHLNSQLIAQGSGVLLKGRYVLTSLHLAKDADSVDPKNVDLLGSIGSAEADRITMYYVGEEPDHDLLLLRFDPGQTGELDSFVCLRSSDDSLQDEEDIALLGFPLGGNLTSRYGVVSRITATLIEAGFNISHGFSGGPVFDVNGRLVGIAKGELQRVESEGTVTDEDIAVMVPVDLARAITLSVPSATNEECGGLAEPNQDRWGGQLPSRTHNQANCGGVVIGGNVSGSTVTGGAVSGSNCNQ